MKAIVQKAYGGPEVLAFEDVDPPDIKDDEVLVRVSAAALHAGDVFIMRGKPAPIRLAVGLFKPKNYIPGYDAAGLVAAVGKNVKNHQVGDEVFGGCTHSCAELVSAKAGNFVAKPKSLTFEQAAAIPTSALAALHGLRDAGKVQAGQKVLINGASGGVGVYAVQIAKSLGAEVTGVCSTRNVEMVRSIGADHVIDYTKEDFTQGGPRYDLILDNVASRSLSDLRRATNPAGKIIPNSGNAGMGYMLKAVALSLFASRQGRPYLSVPKRDDLLFLKQLVDDGKLAPVIDRTYSLEEAPVALGYLDKGHAKGKVVIQL